MMITNAWLAMRFLIVFFVIYLTAAATVWSDTSISLALNQGAFSALEGKYLYVIDANCQASNGILLTSTPPDTLQSPVLQVLN